MFGLFGNKKKDFTATVNGGAASFEVKAGDNLLKAALAAGVSWPHDCRVGSCGACAAVVKKGKIKALTDFSYVLDGEQLKAGTVLACQCVLRGDIEVEVELADMPETEMIEANGTISKVTDLTYDIKELVVSCDKDIPREMLAGQYAEIEVEGVAPARSYSFAKAPTNENTTDFTFFIRHVKGGAFTDWLFESDRVGTAIKLSAPYGQFYRREETSQMVCIAGGSGMSAIKSILEDCVINKVQRNCVYLFGARTQNDLYCASVMQEIKNNWHPDYTFEYIPVLSGEPEESNWSGPTGYVTDYFQDNFVKTESMDLNNAQGYLCGPPPMIDSAIELLTAAGINEESIYFDKFLDASSKPGSR